MSAARSSSDSPCGSKWNQGKGFPCGGDGANLDGPASALASMTRKRSNANEAKERKLADSLTLSNIRDETMLQGISTKRNELQGILHHLSSSTSIVTSFSAF